MNIAFEIARGDKAIINVKSDSGSDITCMIDTGANIPIWFMGESYLKKRFPNAKNTGKLAIINGLGKEPLVDIPVWIIPEFKINDDSGKEIVYHGLLVPVIEARKYSFNLLIPLTMLNRTKFSFDYVESANYGFFTIESEKGDYYVRPLYYPDNDKYLNKIQAFIQEGA